MFKTKTKYTKKNTTFACPVGIRLRGRFGALKSDSIHHFFRNACTKSGSLRFHSFPVVDWFCLFIYLWVSTFPLLDCSEFGSFAPNLPLSLRLKVSGCHYNSIYNNTWTKQVKQLSNQRQMWKTLLRRNYSDFLKRHLHLRNRLLDQGYEKIRLIRSLKKFIFRYQDLVEIYSVSAETSRLS
jgi:hypothetical protein